MADTPINPTTPVTNGAIVTAANPLPVTVVGGTGVNQRLFSISGADMTLTTDQAFTKLFTGTLWIPTQIVAVRATGAFGSACAGGIYPAAAKAGTAIVAAGQSWAALTGANTSVLATLNTQAVQTTILPYLSLTTGNTGALTANIFIYGVVVD
jgi:hypothetical protein